MDNGAQISPENRRIARNTVLLYVRMFVLLLIGLFTSRVVLNQLGIDDYGVYNAVGGLVTMFTIVSASVTSSIVRYISFSLGLDDIGRLRRVFATSMTIQCILALIVVILVETLGLWFLHEKMVIPEGRMEAAGRVLQCSAGMLVFNLLSIPYNACITAHEDMSAFAWISLIEGALKLFTALALYFSPADKLKTYAVLMLAAAIITRLCYTTYCRRHYAETRGRVTFDRSLIGEMSSFAGWNFLGSGTYLVNTQGVNLLSNLFFGVAVNAARGVALQVEGIVKQMVSGFLTALNPQITKSFASERTDYCFSLVLKGSKFAFIVIWLFALPLFFEADFVLDLWLVRNPAWASLFVKLTLLGLLADMVGNPLLTLVLATGRIKRYYIVTSIVSLLVFPLAWLCFRAGLPAWTAYVCFAVIYAILLVVKVLLLKNICNFPAGRFSLLVLRMIATALLSAIPATAVGLTMTEGWGRLLAVTAVSVLGTAAASWFLLLTPGEKTYFKSKLKCL